MRKLQIHELTTKLINTYSETEIPKSEILLAGIPTGKIVPGAFLEAAVSWDNFYLLFMTDDIPQEDMLGIHLLDKKLNLIDSATLGAMYSTGSFSILKLIPPNSINFRFIGGIDWNIELLTKPALRLPFVTDPKGVSRKFGFKRHFKIHGRPLPERERIA